MKHKLIHKLSAAACLFALLLSLAPAAFAAPANSGNPFTDVAPDMYYADAVLWAYENGVTEGMTDTTFAPDAACTRGQVMTFLWRAMGKPEPVTQNNPFEDIKPSDYYYKPILWAYENGVTVGSGDTTFSPGDTCTNGHVVTFLWRTNGQPAASGASPLADSFPADYYTSAIAWADSSGLLADTGAAFSPLAQSPRANIVTYLYRNQAAETVQPEQPLQPEAEESSQPEESYRPEETSQPEESAPPEDVSQPEESYRPEDLYEPEESYQPEKASREKPYYERDLSADTVRAIIYSLQSEYPEGLEWTNDDSYYCEPLRTIGYGCAAFVLICSDEVFGDLPVSDVHSDFDRIRVGDIIRAYHDTHSVIVLEKGRNSVIVAEGNYNSSIHWGREISRQELEEGNFSVQSRYPA